MGTGLLTTTLTCMTASVLNLDTVGTLQVYQINTTWYRLHVLNTPYAQKEVVLLCYTSYIPASHYGVITSLKYKSNILKGCIRTFHIPEILNYTCK